MSKSIETMNEELYIILQNLKPSKRPIYLLENGYENIPYIIGLYSDYRIAKSNEESLDRKLERKAITKSKKDKSVAIPSIIQDAKNLIESKTNNNSVVFPFDTSNEPLPTFSYTQEWYDNNLSQLEERKTAFEELFINNGEEQQSEPEPEPELVELKVNKNEYNNYLQYKLDEANKNISRMNDELTAKDDIILRKDAELTAKDAELTAKDDIILRKDTELTAKDAELTAKDAIITTKDAEITNNIELNKLKKELKEKTEYIAKITPQIGQSICKDEMLKSVVEENKRLLSVIENIKNKNAECPCDPCEIVEKLFELPIETPKLNGGDDKIRVKYNLVVDNSLIEGEYCLLKNNFRTCNTGSSSSKQVEDIPYFADAEYKPNIVIDIVNNIVEEQIVIYNTIKGYDITISNNTIKFKNANIQVVSKDEESILFKITD